MDKEEAFDKIVEIMMKDRDGTYLANLAEIYEEIDQVMMEVS